MDEQTQEAEPRQPGATITCSTGPSCGAVFVPGQGKGWGVRDGKPYCARCQKAIKDGRTPGPRIRNPPGQKRTVKKTAIQDELLKLVTPEVLAAQQVASVEKLLAKLLAVHLQRPELA